MPPPIPRGSLNSLPRCRSSQTISLSTRAFATSTRLSSIGPENPKFIEVPRSRQRDAIPHRDIKGTLPPPRNLFPRRSPNKTSAEYLASIAPGPTTSKKQKEPANERVAWRRRMAEGRRANLRESLVELKKRHLDRTSLIGSIGGRKKIERTQALNAPQREDERLTNPTITAAMSELQIGALPDPDREQRIAEKKARIAAKEAAKEEQRKDALHTLYMHARDFIVTEEQLNEEIEKIFVEEPFGLERAGKQNIWDAYDAPQTVQDMLLEVNNTQKKAVAYHAGPAAVTGARLKRIAEELTGGKMD